MTRDDTSWSRVILTKPLGITPKQMRWWFERHVKHGFTLRTSWSRSNLDEAEFWHLMGWYHRQAMFDDVIKHLTTEWNYPVGNAATFAFENKGEGMLFKLTHGGA